MSDYVYAEAVRAQEQGKLVNLRPADMSSRDIPEPFNIYHIDEAEDHASVLANIAKVMAGTSIPTRGSKEIRHHSKEVRRSPDVGPTGARR